MKSQNGIQKITAVMLRAVTAKSYFFNLKKNNYLMAETKSFIPRNTYSFELANLQNYAR